MLSRIIAILFICLLPSALVLAVDNPINTDSPDDSMQSSTVDKCKQLVVVGDTDWVPYAIKTDTVVTGVGIDLVKGIFSELDIPVKELNFTDKRSIYHGLLLGDIDILVSLYPNAELGEFLEIIEPGYNPDPITVLMHAGKSGNIKRWDDLIGLHGIITRYFTLEKDFAEYVESYLYVTQQDDLHTTLDFISKKKFDYMLGSKAQLEYALKLVNNKDDFALLENISAPMEVRMGFSKQSQCKAYLPFLRKNLLELKDSGAVAEKIAAYMAKAAAPNPTEELPKPEQNSDINYLLGI